MGHNTLTGHRSPRLQLRNALIAMLFAAPLAVGSVHLPVIVTLFACFALLMGALIAVRWGKGLHLPYLAMLGLLLLGLTVAQCVPLPATVLGAIAPTNLAAHRGAEAFLGALLTTVGPYTISLEPSQTAIEAIKLFSLFSAFFLALHCFRRRTDFRLLLTSLGWLAVVLVAIGLLHKLSGTEKILFFYRPDTLRLDKSLFQSTFVNGNNLAGLLILISPICLGRVLAANDSRSRYLAGFQFVVTCVGIVLSLSRAGILVMLGGITLVLTVGQFQRATNGRLRRGALLAFGCIALIATWSAYEPLTKELASIAHVTDETKLKLLPGSLDLIGEHWTVGVGKGAFFAPYGKHATAHTNLFLRVENQLIQIFVDWGIPIGLFVLCSLLVFLAPLLRHTGKSPRHLGCFVGLLSVAIHNLADFNLDILGAAIPCAALLGGWLGQLSASSSSKQTVPYWLKSIKLRPMIAAIGLVAILASLTLPLFDAVENQFSAAEKRLQTALKELGTNTARRSSRAKGQHGIAQIKTTPGERRLDIRRRAMAFQRRFAPEIRQHPTYYYLPFLVGAALYRQSLHDQAKRWLSHALQLSPGTYHVRQLLARTLLLTGDKARSLALFMANYRDFPSKRATILLEALLAFPREASLFQLLRDDQIGRYLQFLARRGLLASATFQAENRLKTKPADAASRRFIFRRMLKRNDLFGASDFASQTIKAMPRSALGHIFTADVARLSKTPSMESEALMRAAAMSDVDFSSLLRLHALLLRSKSIQEAAAILKKLERLSYQNKHRRRVFRLSKARQLVASGNPLDVVRLFEAELRRRLSLGIGLELMRLYRQLAFDNQAMALIRRLEQRFPGNVQLRNLKRQMKQ